MNRPQQVSAGAPDQHALTQTGRAGRPSGPTWDRLEDQVDWYDRKSASSQRISKRLTVLQLVAAAMVPVAATVDAAAWMTSGLGALVVVVEGIQQLGEYQQNWTNYRSTCEASTRSTSTSPLPGITRPWTTLSGCAPSGSRASSPKTREWTSASEEHAPSSTR